MTQLAYGTVDGRDELPRSARDLSRKSDHLYSHDRWLRVEEAAHPGAHLYTWAQKGAGTAFAAAYRFGQDSNPWPAARLDLFLAEYAGTTAGDLLLPHYLLGGRRPGHSRILTDGPARDRRELLTAIVSATAARAVRQGAATIAAMYCDRDDDDLAAAFVANGGVRFPSPGLNTLDLPGASVDAWLASLPRKRQQVERADQRKLRTAGVSYELRPLRREDIDEIIPLELTLYRKYGHHYHEAEAKALHLAYVDVIGPDALIVRAYRHGQLIGFISIVRHGATAYLRQGGFDPHACGDAPVYFGAVFHQPIAWAYPAGVRHLDLSTSADDAKHHRGARTRPRDAWVVPLTMPAATALNAAAARVSAAAVRQ